MRLSLVPLSIVCLPYYAPYVLNCVCLGAVLSLFGESVSTSYETGVKVAISDYYNDQIRELYEHKPHEVALKEVRVSSS